MLILLLLFMSFHVQAQGPSRLPPQNEATNLLPNLAIVLGLLLTFMLSLALVLLFCIKFCHRALVHHNNNPFFQDNQIISEPRFSGIDKEVINSLPFFRFSSLTGSREGLACAICLSKFEDIEVLRLLPKCKHGFHIDCIDQWLEKHSTCPLCRDKVTADDASSSTNATSFRFFPSHNSELREDSNLELFLEREETHQESPRFGRSSRFGDTAKKENHLPIQENCCNQGKIFHKFNHKIVASDIVLKNRWSNLSSSDLMFLNYEMLRAYSRGGIEEEKKDQIKHPFLLQGSTSDTKLEENLSCRGKVLVPTEKRSMSEITVHPRLNAEQSVKDVIRDSSSVLSRNGGKEERMKRLWMPIARRTVEWFADRERKSQSSHGRRESLNV